MKIKLKLAVVAFCMLGVGHITAFAATKPNKTINTRTQILEQEVQQLKAEVNGLKAQATPSNTTNNVSKNNPKKLTTFGTGPVTIGTQPFTGEGPQLPVGGPTYLPIDLDVPGQSFVSSGPYIGIPLEFSGSNLIINSPSVNRDVALLKIRKNIANRLAAVGIVSEDRPHVLLSGLVEAQAFYQKTNGDGNRSAIDFTGSNLDAYILGPSRWLSSLIEFSYDNDSGVGEGSFSQSNSRVLDSRIFLNQGFITVGDFRTTRFYGTFGQLYVPFGTYSSNMVSAPLTKIMGRTKARAIVVGYQGPRPKAFYAAGYAFRGDSYTGRSASNINNGGINIGYRSATNSPHFDIGAGVIANIADSVGMQFTENAPMWGGFSAVGGFGNEHLSHRVPAFDVHGMLSIGQHIDLLGEYIITANSFNPNDLKMNSHGARPQALNLEGAYSFQAFNRPTSVALGYGMSRDALALLLPEHRISAVLNTSIWKSTLESLEFRHDIGYSSSSTATGSQVPLLVTGGGKSNNTVTAQFDIYF